MFRIPKVFQQSVYAVHDELRWFLELYHELPSRFFVLLDQSRKRLVPSKLLFDHSRGQQTLDGFLHIEQDLNDHSFHILLPCFVLELSLAQSHWKHQLIGHWRWFLQLYVHQVSLRFVQTYLLSSSRTDLLLVKRSYIRRRVQNLVSVEPQLSSQRHLPSVYSVHGLARLLHDLLHLDVQLKSGGQNGLDVVTLGLVHQNGWLQQWRLLLHFRRSHPFLQAIGSMFVRVHHVRRPYRHHVDDLPHQFHQWKW